MWSHTLQLLRQRLTPEVYTTWVPQLRFVNYTDGLLVLGVPSNAFVQTSWPVIGRPLTDAYHEVFGPATQLKFTLIEDTDNSRSGQVTVPRGTSALPLQSERAGGEARGLEGKNGKADTTDGQGGAAQQQAAQHFESYLNPDYTFEAFVEGRSNHLARTIAESIAKTPHQTTFNPFFLFGPPGVGKTHLVNAIGLHIRQFYPNLRVLFVTAHVFRTQYTDAVVSNHLNDFIHFYQTIDVLIIDDFQEITTAKTQQAFFHIFNHLHLNNRKIIITCDRPPSQFEGLEERMLSRLKWGAVTPIERPDLELRRAILLSKMRSINLELPPAVVRYIADNVSDNVRELEGCINSLLISEINGDGEMTLENARRVVGRIVAQRSKEMTLDTIMTAVSEHYRVKQRDLIGKSRRKELVAVRQLVMHLAQKYTSMSLTQIGRAMGGRDHSTVSHSCEVVQRRYNTDKAFRLEVEKLEERMKG